MIQSCLAGAGFFIWDKTLRNARGMARLIMDDAYSVGPADILLLAIQRSWMRAGFPYRGPSARCSLIWCGQMLANTIPGFTLAGWDVDETVEPGFREAPREILHVQTVC